jgi:dTDP-4-dehydrorhamnose reductase
MRIVVTGAGGQLGHAIVRRFRADHDVIALARAELDLTDHREVLRRLHAADPHVIINCAAHNAVDRAEDDAAAAIAVNALAVRSLARAAAESDAALVHYSTDFVFDGAASVPYEEDDRPAPLSVYGETKLLGELFARDAPRHYVLRVESLFGGPQPRSSIDRIVDAILEQRPARVFVDRVVSPSYVEDVAEATAALIHRDAAGGLYHCVNSGSTTWHGLALEVAGALGRTADLVPVRMADAPMRAQRPRYCALSNGKLAAAGVVMPSWQDAIRRYVGSRRAV